MRLFIGLLICCFLFNCEKKNDTTDTKTNEEFAKLLDNYYEDGLKLEPLSATAAGDDRYNNLFPNYLSQEYKEEQKSYYKKYLTELENFKDEDLSDAEKLSKQVLKWDCDSNLEKLNFKREYFPLDQMWSLNLYVGQLASGASAQPFETVEDYNNWFSRLNGYYDWLITAKKNMQEGAANGYVLPKSLIKKVIPQLQAMTTKNLDEHLFYTPVKNMSDSFSDEEKQKITDDYAKILTEKIIPAYKDLADYVATDYLNAGRDSSGISEIPDGKSYYDFAIKQYTTTEMTADEIHELGLKEVARIRSEMEKVKDEVGFKGSLKEFFDDVRENKKLMPFTQPEQVIESFDSIYTVMKPQVDKLFGKKPKTPFEVRRIEAFREKSSSAQYNPGSVDGTRPGIFYVPIPDVIAYNNFADESLFLHEAIPGHHYQISLTQENEDLPDFRKTLWYSAYGEGWALYTESLGKELGLYSDPYQYFGMLSMEMHRAIRLVVDTGLHAKGWTREQAIQYSLDNEAESEAGIISEIERYMANPGQALSYKIGQLKIRELRAKAEKELGENFDIKAFHDQVLETGCIPLALLEDKINAWIESEKL